MMPYQNSTLMDSLDEFYQTNYSSVDSRLFVAQITAILYGLSVILTGLTLCMRSGAQAPPTPPATWHAVGFYDLRSPQTLTKRERAAAATHDGKNAVLYEKTYASGARAWRYSLNGYDWFYPTRTAVARRGLTNNGDILVQE